MSEDLRLVGEHYSTGGDIFSVHYSSQSFLEVDAEPIAISAIAIHDLRRGVVRSLSRVDAPAGEDAELFILETFYAFLSAHRDAVFLHWDMGSAEFGFEILAKRYFFKSSKTPAVETPRQQFDVDKLIRAKFGHDYAPHGRLESISKLNDLDLRGFLPGIDEAAKFPTGAWNDLARSSAAKSRLISDLFVRLLQGKLRTNNSAGRISFAGGDLDAVSTILAIGERFLLVQRKLSSRERGRAPVDFDDEYDDQYLFHALLVQYFEDVRAEEYVPEYAGGNSRVDFSLREYGLVVELKHTRGGLTDRKLGEELIIDSARYAAAKDASHLLVLVFDHGGNLGNPRGLERDLQRDIGSADLAVTVKILDR